MLELREKRMPDADDEFARALGSYEDLAALRAEIQKRLERNALDRARHVFADRIIDFAVANATVDLPDLLIELRAGSDARRAQGAPRRAGHRLRRLPARHRARREPRSATSSSRTQRSGSRRCSCCRPSRTRRRSRSPTRSWPPSSSVHASATRTARGCCRTSNRRVARPTLGHCCAARRSSRRSSIAGSPSIPSSRTSSTSRSDGQPHDHMHDIHIEENA